MATCQYVLKDFTAIDTLLGVTLFTITGASIVPAILKPIRRKSTDGLSRETVILTNLQQTFTAANVTVLKFPQLKACFSSDDVLGCQPPILVFWQSIVAWVMLFLVFLGCLWYPNPNDEITRSQNKWLWILQLVICFGFVGILAVWSMFTDCPEMLASIGQVCGYISSLFMVFRFAPQLYTTYTEKGAGSMSYTTYVVIGMGGFVMTYFQVAVSGEGVSIWLPVFVGNVFQTLIIFTAAWYDCGPGKSVQAAYRLQKRANSRSRSRQTQELVS